MNQPSDQPKNDFEELADKPRSGLIKEFFEFLKQNKKWWLLPIILVLCFMGILVFISSSPIAPFIYPLF